MTTRRGALKAIGAASAFAVLHRPTPVAAQSLESEIRDAMSSHNVPGLAYAVIENGAIADTGAFGQRARGAPVSPATRFQAASLSKTVNALCVLTLVRDGVVGLDDPVNRHLSGWKLGGRKDAGKVTIRQLLSHTGGVSVSGFGGYNRKARIPSLSRILQGRPPANSEAVRVVEAPGRRYAYSGGGVTVLQKLVGDVTDQPYAEAVDRRVLRPLRMGNSSMVQPPRAAELAHGHNANGRTVDGGYNIYPEMAAAGLWTTPGDMARALAEIMRSLRGGQDALLPRQVANEITRSGFDGIGLGVFVDGEGRLTHNGVNWGFRCTYTVSPARQRGYVVMSNGENGEELNAFVGGLLAQERDWDSI